MIAAVLGAASLALSVGATPASAVIANIGGHSYGVTPIRGINAPSLPGAYRVPGSLATLGRAGPRPFDGPPKGGGLMLYHNGPVMHGVTTHVIYWDPNSEFTATTKGIIGKFFTDVAHDKELASNVFAVAGQYKDGSGHAAYSSTFGSEGTDAIAYPASGCVPPEGVDEGPYSTCLTDAQLQEQLSAYISVHSLPTGPTQQYFVLLPHKVATCLPEEEGVLPCSNNFFCAYHSSINPGSPNEIIYSDIPFSLLDSTFAKGCQDDGNIAIQHPNGDTAGTDESTRFADVALKYTSHEYIEASTDPLGSAYFDANGLEIGDKCNGVTADEGKDGIGYDANSFLPELGGSAGSGNLFDQSINADDYYLQSEWDNAAKACEMKPVALSQAKFSASPPSGIVSAPIEFKGAATDIYAGLSFVWKWGDGTESAGATPSHTYAAAGTYEVTMTPKDELTGSTTTPVSHMLVVEKASQTIAFTSTAPGSATVGGPTYTVTATASSALSASFSSGTPSVCSLSGSTVSFIAVGTCTIDADQAGSANYTAAPQKHQSFAVSQGSQTITFTSTAPSSAAVGGPTYAVAAMASSGLAVSFSSGAPSVCSLTSSTVSFIAAGTCTIDANQAGNADYTAAPQAQQSFSVSATPASTAAVIVTSPLTAKLAPMLAPDSNFSALGATVNPTTGAITFTESVGGPGTFSWLLTFQNGKFGVFASRNTKCKNGFVRLNGRCRPAKVVFARGGKTISAAGALRFTVKPSASALKALRNALKQKKGLPVTMRLTFQSSRGGGPASQTQSLTVGLKQKK